MRPAAARGPRRAATRRAAGSPSACRCAAPRPPRRPRRRDRRRRRAPAAIGGRAGVEPGDVGRHDQRGDLAGRLAGGLHRAGAVGCDRPGARRGVHPPRHRSGEPDDVRRQRRVVLRVVGGVVADDVHDRRRRPAGVVQVGEPVGEPGPEVQQRRRRSLGHACVAVGHPGDDALEQPEHRPHPVDPVDRGDEVHLRRPGLAKQTSTPLATSVRSRLSAPFTSPGYMSAPFVRPVSRTRRAAGAEPQPSRFRHVRGGEQASQRLAGGAVGPG